MTQQGGDSTWCLLRLDIRRQLALHCRVEEGVRKEPFEELMCEVEEDHTGAVIEAVTLRKGEVRRRRRLRMTHVDAFDADQMCLLGALSLHTQWQWASRRARAAATQSVAGVTHGALCDLHAAAEHGAR